MEDAMVGKKNAKTCICCIMLLLFVSSTALAQNDCKETYGEGSVTVTLATGSPGELGMLKVLADAFNKTHDATICWKKAGSGASLKLLKNKKADIIMVHAPAAEKKSRCGRMGDQTPSDRLQ